MRASGNGKPSVCVENLLKCARTEVPYTRSKGLNPRLIDTAMGDASTKVRQDAELVIEVFEPRAVVNSIHIGSSDMVTGSLSVTADITEREV